MLESLSQVGTNCHKVQNVLVAWGVYSLLTMAHHPGVEADTSHSSDGSNSRAFCYFFFFCLAFRSTCKTGSTL